jgi:signal transduction histidine kinase
MVTAGVSIEVRIEGRRRALPAGVDLSAYRIVQEALTNVIKHAGQAPTRVLVRYDDDAVTVEVDNDAPSDPKAVVAPALSGAGHGLVGMRERVALYAGDFVADHRAGGGFHVRARLPYSEVAT